jgi:hypothetical protein
MTDVWRRLRAVRRLGGTLVVGIDLQEPFGKGGTHKTAPLERRQQAVARAAVRLATWLEDPGPGIELLEKAQRDLSEALTG